MKRICKQCGKEFTLTQSEINFYKSKNLAFPKRCKECRTENKVNKQTKTEAAVAPEEKTAVEAETAAKLGAKAVTGIQTESTTQAKQPAESRYISEEEPVSQARPEAYKPQREKPQIVKKLWIAVAAVLLIAIAVIFPNLTKKSGSAGVLETKGYTENTTGADVVSDESDNANDITDNTSDSRQNVTVKVRFRNNTLLQQHYNKHGKDMGFASAVEYEIAAAAVVNNPKALHKTEAEDGDDVYYIEKTNEFVIVSKDGYIRTYFNPSDGINYYNRQ